MLIAEHTLAGLDLTDHQGSRDQLGAGGALGPFKLYSRAHLCYQPLDVGAAAPVVIFASRNNPGAAEVALDLARAIDGLCVGSEASHHVVEASLRPSLQRPQICAKPEASSRQGGATARTSVSRTSRMSTLSSEATSSMYSGLRNLGRLTRSAVSSSEGSSSTTNITVKTPWAPPDAEPTLLLLYLNSDTFAGEAGLQLEAALSSSWACCTPVLLVHERRPDHGACDFSRFFAACSSSILSRELFQLYMAIPYHGGAQRSVSLAVIAEAIRSGLPVRGHRDGKGGHTSMTRVTSSSRHKSSRSSRSVVDASQTIASAVTDAMASVSDAVRFLARKTSDEQVAGGSSSARSPSQGRTETAV